MMELANISGLFKKIGSQSVFVLVLMFLTGCFLLKTDNSPSTLTGILGHLLIATGLICSLLSFLSNLIEEKYEDIIKHYKGLISTQRSSNKEMQKGYKSMMLGEEKNNKTEGVGEYVPMSDDGTKSS